MIATFQRRPVLWGFLSYCGLTLVLTYPLARRLGSALPGDPGDPVLNTWILWWNTQALPLSDRWWSPPVFFPVADAITFSENLLGLLPISAPVQWLFGNPVLAYNVAFLLSFPLSGLSAFLLCRDLTGRNDAGWIAGLIFAFAPYRFDHLSHIQVLSWYWVPVILLALHRFLGDGRTRWLMLFGMAYLFQGLTNGYLFLFIPALVGLWVLWFVPLVRLRRTAASIALAGVVAGAFALPLLLRYQCVHHRFGFERSLLELTTYSGDLTAILSAPRSLALWGWMDRFQGPEAQLFPGLTVVCLIAVAVVRCLRPRAETPPRWITWLRRLLVTVALFFLFVVLSRLVLGPWELDAFGLHVSVNQVDKPFSFAALFLTALAVVSPVVLAARSRRSFLGFYLIAAVAMWILTWGPFPTIAQQPLIEHAPYSWLRVIPGFEGLRVPARFWILATVCLSATGGLVLARIVPAGSRYRHAIVGLVACGLIADGWVTEMPLTAAPRFSASVEAGRDGAILELPAGQMYDDLEAMYRAMFHGRPVVNGFSGFTPSHYLALTRGLTRGEDDVLDLMVQLGVRDVVINRPRDMDGRAARFLSGYKSAQLVSETPTEMLFRLARGAGVENQQVVGLPLTIRNVSANVNDDDVGKVFDDDLTSRWQTGPQRRGHQLVVDLGAVQPIGAIKLWLGPFAADAPRVLQIAVSDDGVNWRQMWRGPTAAQAIAAAIRDPAAVEMAFRCDGCRGRFVRLRQLGRDRIYDWSIAELSVLGTGS